jgi:hypothetical protein
MDRIKVDREGRIFWRNLEVTHHNVKRYLLSLMERDEEGVWVKSNQQKMEVDLEDTPFYVEALREEEQGGRLVLRAILNDGTEEILDIETLRVASDNKVYCRIKGGKFEALLSLSAYWQLTRYLVEDGGEYYLQLGSTKHPLRGNEQEDIWEESGDESE